MQRADQALLRPVVTDRFAHRINPRAQHRVSDDPALPHFPENLFPAYDTVTILNKKQEKVKNLGLDRLQCGAPA